jgi:hypothetical protein
LRLLRRDPLQQIHHNPVGFDRFRGKAGIAAADIGLTKVVLSSTLPVRISAAQRAVGHQTNTKFL